ncbi:MAG TPA: Uma2 family endonuclease [Pirellulales bacterium]|jgi:Uma2 family endonuclease
MSTLPTKRYTLQEYLALDRKAERKSEYFQGEIFQMAGASFAHNLIVANLLRELGNQLKGRNCIVVPSELRTKVDRTGLYTYPDALVVCDEPQFDDEHRDTILNPTLIVEVLSDSTEGYDRGAKFGHYRKIESLQQYVLIEQNRQHFEVYTRQPDDNWLLSEFEGAEATASLSAIDCRLKLVEVYEKVTFEAAGQ